MAKTKITEDEALVAVHALEQARSLELEARDALAAELREITAPLEAAIAACKARHESMITTLSECTFAREAEAKKAVLALAKTVAGPTLTVVYVKKGFTADVDGLIVYGEKHPEVLSYLRPREPYARVTGK